MTHVLPRRPTGTGVLATLLLVLTAAGTGYLAVHDRTLAAAVVLMPLAGWLLSRRRALLMVLAATIPYTRDLSGGALGVSLVPSDLIMTVLLLGLLADWLLTHQAPELAPVKPLLAVLFIYLGLLVVVFAVHLQFRSAVDTYQRVGLFLVPLIIGVMIVQRGYETRFLQVYVACTSVFGVAWYFLGDAWGLGQKNPVGGFIANALIVAITVKPVRQKLWWCSIALVPSLFLTQSRGAIISVGVAVLVFLALQTGLNRARALIAMVPLAILTVVAFQLLPEDVQDRNTEFTASTDTRAGYAIKIRDQYHADAWDVIHAHPWTGIGVGNYLTGTEREGTITTDPHQALLLQTAEGGYPLGAGFLLLGLGTAIVVARVTRRESLGPAAVAVHSAIFVHGLVDVYWVRGTPVLGWLLIGMALAQAARRDGAGPVLEGPKGAIDDLRTSAGINPGINPGIRAGTSAR